MSIADRSSTYALANSLTLDFLEWLSERPRSYAEAMEAWRTSCPRLSIWEDALADGLVVVERLADITCDRVAVTPKGQALIAQR